jgi:anti-sigma factor ChrR (cupin superfamily)
MARQLTEMQQKFLDVLFDEAKGDTLLAKKLAGYSDNVSTSQVVAALEEEIHERTRKFIARSATKAAYSLADILDEPTQMGAKERIAAAKDILDRGGLVKTEKLEVTSNNPLFILPSKQEEDE